MNGTHNPAVGAKLRPLQLNGAQPHNALMARLYNTPQDSGVLKAVMKPPQKRQLPKLPGSPEMIPKPPSGPGSPTNVFRTTMLKKDYERRKVQKKARIHRLGSSDSQRTLSVSMLQRNPVKDNNMSEADSHSDIDFDDLGSVSSITSKLDQDLEKSGSVVSALDTQDNEINGEKTRTSKITGENIPQGHSPTELPTPTPPSPTLTNVSKASRVKSATYGTRKVDPDLVLTYKKKNIYDDTVPDDDRFIEHILSMRANLKWSTEIPRHGPGSREAIDALIDEAANPKEGLNTQQDDGQFVYALLRHRNNTRARYDPYDLEVVSAHVARAAPVYFTGSASTITKCIQLPGGGEDSTAVSTVQWLWERRLFYMIFNMKIFSQFRIWKGFRCWFANVRNQKNTSSRVILTKKLFAANEVLQGCMMHIRNMCEAASGSLSGVGAGDDAITLVNLNRQKTFSLPEFLNMQREQGHHALKQLNALRDKIVALVWESCATVAEMEGITHGIRADKKSKKIKFKQPDPESLAKKYKNLNSKHVDMPKLPDRKIRYDRPTYAQIAEWRKILERLSFFLKSVDYMMLELLRRLVVTASQNLLNHIMASFEAGNNLAEEDEEEFSDSDYTDSEVDPNSPFGKQSSRTKYSKYDSDSPTSKAKSKLRMQKKSYVIPQYNWSRVSTAQDGFTDIDRILDDIKQMEHIEVIPEAVICLELVLNVPAGEPPPTPGTPMQVDIADTSDEDEGDGHGVKKSVRFPNEPEMSESEDSEDGSSQSESDEESVTESQEKLNRFAYPVNSTTKSNSAHSAHNQNRTYITLEPGESNIKNSVRGIISGFENTVGQVTSMLREPKLAVFYSPPKYDLKLNFDEEEDEEKKLNMRPWPDTESLFGEDPAYQALVGEICTYTDAAVAQVVEYTERFNQYCQMVDRSRRVDVVNSMSKRPWSTEEFFHVLEKHTEMKSSMGMMETEKRVSMIFVQSSGFKDSCLPYPKQVVDAVHYKMPIIANQRNDNLLTIIKGASKKLDTYPESVEDFVEHLSFLSRMQSEMPALDKEFAIVTKLFTIAQEFHVALEPEEFALYQTLAPSFQHLKSTILFCDAKKDENIQKFSKDLDTLVYEIRHKIDDLRNRVRDPILLSDDTLATVALENIKYITDEVNDLSNKAKSYASYQDRFGSSLSAGKKMDEYTLLDRRDESLSAAAVQAELSEIERDLTLRRLLWESQEEWIMLVDEWTSTPFEKLNVDSLQKGVNRYIQTVYMLEKGLPHNEVVPKLKNRVFDFKQGMPVIVSLRNPSLRPRHWSKIEEVIGKEIQRGNKFTLGKLLEMAIFQHKDKIQDISTTASNEATLEIMLQKVIDLWQNTDFRLVAHQGRDTYIIAGADDLMAQLEESQVTIATIRGSRYVTPIKGNVEEWERKLTLFARTLDEWMTCQRNWLYLEQIFSTPDIQRQLPSEAKMFASVDKSLKDIMRKTEDRPNALKAATAAGVLEMLQAANANLEKIQKCLEDYLETKRLVFPRFYFLSNDDLLDILAQSKNPEAVQPHLGKCFGNIKMLDIRQIPRQPPTVKNMISEEGEVVAMPKNVRARGPVEQWLGSVETGMFDTVKRHLKLGLNDWLGLRHEEWVLKHPGQVVLTVAQIMFNKDVMACFAHPEPRIQLAHMRDMMVNTLNTLAGLVSTNLISYHRLSIEALLTIDVHNRDILNDMIESKVSKKDDFEWTKQLRYEWDEQTNNCNVMQSNASFTYGYEYLGCSPRLVITPLTDRCYLTLTGALHLHLGGSPAGPAGTGKTETVKDLAKAMGKQCVVFNCSEGLDFKTLGKFFSGLAQSGSWCCFDEFNRIDVEVLSVVAQQIHTIKAAKDLKHPRFVFEGRDIRLNMTCGFFITMNPSYAGRVELPDNLKSLFRPVAMMVPDYARISEIMLFSNGFIAAKSLSRKLVNLYQLASKQLSQQDHYDFGMRAIKSVLDMAGQGKRQAVLSMPLEKARDMSEEDESYILIHSLRNANMPKFLAEDVPLFEGIMQDLFPGIIPPQQDLGVLEKAISMAIRDLNLQHWANQIEKVKQLHQQLLVRHGVMLVGPTGGGKTMVRSILQKTLVLLPTISMDDPGAQTVGPDGKRQSIFVHNRNKKGHVDIFAINPKCVKLGELYGETDPNTFEWSDGLIANAVRKFSRELGGASVDDYRPATSGGHRPSTQGSGAASSLGGPSESVHSEEERPLSSVPPATPVGTTDDQESEIQVAEEVNDAIPTNWRWIVLDGPVDTLWVENLNTVLDDTKVLCLANGERIGLARGMRMLFEVDNLSQASPATISRCAMVYMDPIDLGWRPYVKTWVSRLPKEMPESGKRHLQALFDHSIDKGLAFVKNHQKYQLISAPEQSMVMMLCSIMSAFFDFLGKHGGFGNPDPEPDKRPGSAESGQTSNSRSSSRTHNSSKTPTSRQRKRSRKSTRREQKLKEEMEAAAEKAKLKAQGGKNYYLQKNPALLTHLLGKLFVFAFTWAFGGNFKHEDEYDEDTSIRQRTNKEPQMNITNDFDHLVHEMFDIEPPLGVRLPASSRTIYSFFVDMDSGNFIAWDNLVPTTQSLIDKGATITIGDAMGVSSGGPQKRSASADADIVATVDNVRYSFIMGLLALNKNPVLLTGDSGVGKSSIITSLLSKLCKENGTSLKQGTILGNVLNYMDKNKAIMENISSLAKFAQADDDDASNIDLLMGAAKTKHQTGIVSTMLQFSAQTAAIRLQLQLTLKLIKKGKDVLGAPKGKKVLIFLDDMNMPAPEQYGAQPPLELLRQFLDLGGFYDTTKLSWKEVLDVTPIAACGPPGGGRNVLSPRLLKHFCILSLPQPSTRSLQHIYQVQLGRYFADGDFMPDVKEALFSVVSASIAIYYRMCNAMRPTPAKSHYTFNIRDCSKVIQGMLQAHEEVIVGRETVAQLYCHEATRVFHDRLVSAEDRRIFYQFLSDVSHDYFKVKWTPEQMMEDRVIFGDFIDMAEAEEDRIYKPIGDMDKLATILEEYQIRKDMTGSQSSRVVYFRDAVDHITRAARVFRQPGGHMLLVGLDGTGKRTAVQLACTIADCELFKLTLSRGYNMQDFHDDLKSIYRLAGVKGLNTVFLLNDGDIVQEAFLEDINCILNSGDVPDLFDNEEMDGIAMELRPAATQAEVPDTRVAVHQFFIQRVRNNLHVVLTMSPAGSKFRQRCRMNPALISCCTIDWYDEWSEEAMLSVAKVYFENVEFQTSREHDVTQVKIDVAKVCVDIHNSIGETATRFWEEMRRRYYTTPSSYMELIKIYTNMLRDNRKELMDNRHRLLVGLSKLSEANSLVGTMQEELVNLGPKIEEKAKDTEVLLKQLSKDQEAVDQVRDIVEQEESVMKKETEIVQDYADECQRDLASVLPAVQMAIESLDSLDKADISEIRVYQNPPILVISVMSAVCTLLQQKTDWGTAKQVLGDQGFLKKLINFDKNSVPEKVFFKLKKFTKNEDFSPEKVGTVSVACRSMCQWVLALEHYHEVYKMAKPKQKRVEEARDALKLAQDNLAQKQASLAKITEHLQLLQQQYQDSVNQRESLKERKKLTGMRLERASVLITALSDEKVRWAESVDDLDFKLQGLVGDTLVSSGTVAYLGAFTAAYRKEMMESWVTLCREKQIPISKEYDYIKHMVSPNQVLKWQTEGLPQDGHSTENAIIVKRARRYPLLIDPQGQAKKWIKEMEGSKLKVLQASDPKYMQTMERAIRVGEPVLLEDVTEHLDPSLTPILEMQTFQRGGGDIIKLGDTEIEFNHNFKLYMTNSMGNPHYLPAVCIQVTIINFTVTFDGLQEQLLSAVVRQERPKLEQERSILLESIANDLQLLRDLEDKSLELLQKTEGHILDDQVLVQTLQRSKVMSGEIHKRVHQSEETEKKLNIARKRYLPVATRGAVLYFVIADLANIDVMYQFSLHWFRTMFSSCISDPLDSQPQSGSSSHLSGTLRPSSARSSPELSSNRIRESAMRESSADLTKHLTEMIDRLTITVYKTVSVALFANHQLLLSLMLCANIMRAIAKYTTGYAGKPGKITETEWTVFLQGPIMSKMLDESQLEEHDGLTPMQRLELQSRGGVPVPRLTWIADNMWRQCQHLEVSIDVFKDLCKSIINNRPQWEAFGSSDRPYHLMATKYERPEGELPDLVPGIQTTGTTFHWEILSDFQRLLLIKILRPEMTTATIRSFVEEQMGSQFVSAGHFDLKEMFEKSTAKTPLIFILSPGSDPGAQLLRFAKDLRGSTLHLDMISLGRGQGPKAEELINKAQILKGRWLFLQNCHLAASWMHRLQAIVEKFNMPNSDVDPQFRLFLSSKPDPCFPIPILQTGLKMTVEAPQGLKAKLLQAFSPGGAGSINDKMYDDAEQKVGWKNLLFGLCIFNAVINERKKYGPLGWNIPYEFNDSDLEVCVLVLGNLFGKQENIPWAALKYLTGEVSYGGRVTDDWDRRTLHSMLNKFYCPAALEPDYSYSPDGIYHPLPQTFSFSDTRMYVEGLPNSDSPELFGMTENSEKAYLEAQSFQLIDTLVSIQPRLTQSIMRSGGKSSDTVVLDMVLDILRTLPEIVEYGENEQGRPRRTISKAVKEFSTNDKENAQTSKESKPLLNSALVIVLRQEIDRFNLLLGVIHKSLKALTLAIKGEIVMSDELEEAYNAMLKQRVPARWKQMSYESCKPLFPWVKDLVQRVDMFYNWSELVINALERPANQKAAAKTVTDPDELDKLRDQPRSFWLPGFFFPQGFLTGVLQNHARKMGVSVDSLSFNFEVMSHKLEGDEDSLNEVKKGLDVQKLAFKGSAPPDDGVLVFGLYIDGARWDVSSHSLQDSLPGQRYCRLPEIHFLPVQINTDPVLPTPMNKERENKPAESPKDDSGVTSVKAYESPLYRTSTRAGTLSSAGHSTNFVTAVELPTIHDPAFWGYTVRMAADPGKKEIINAIEDLAKVIEETLEKVKAFENESVDDFVENKQGNLLPPLVKYAECFKALGVKTRQQLDTLVKQHFK
ncbi:unnamed protein product [Owenia fusiformis]|uniref:AAA+ ATPase domain-containing protein n=1 Tax=Owenia fusiformis TaxID=6347 RepID=A0A8S4PDL5_OWEFU|nr:unnamed protein product [Owenia fusiformis]